MSRRKWSSPPHGESWTQACAMQRQAIHQSSVAAFRSHLCSHCGLAGAIPSMAVRRPSTLSVASEATQQSPKVGNANQSCKCSAKFVSQNAKNKSNIPSFDVGRSVVRAAEQEVDVPTYGDSISFSVCLESSTQHAILGRKVRVFKPNGSGFETQAAGDAC